MKALLLHAQGEKREDIAKKTEYAKTYISELVVKYKRGGLEAIVENHYKGNRRNMTVEEEASFLEPYKEKAERGEIIEANAIKRAYEEKVGHRVGSGQIYYVLKRQGWRKVMPRSKHPNRASEEAIEASKKLRLRSETNLTN